ncbi:MAG: prenyltransferase/squalene oxidase repeat-containing protein, partial [Planctomycetota bacterium]
MSPIKYFHMPQEYYYSILKRYIPIILISLICFLINSFLYPGETDKPARQSGGSDQLQPLSSSEWKDQRFAFLKLYNNNSPVKRNNAIEFIDTQLYNKLLISDIKYAVETMEFLLQVLSAEEYEAVAITTEELLAKFLIQPNYMEWMLQNYKKLVSHELIKSRFIDTLRITAKSSKNESIIKILTDLINKEEKAFLKLSALDVLYRYFPSKSVDIMLDMVQDADLNISKFALNCLSELKPMERRKIRRLIKLLGEEKREEIKKGIGQILEKITGRKYKTHFSAWEKWWMDQPITQQKIDDAIIEGVDFLVQHCSTPNKYDSELVFYTLIKSGVQIPQPLMQVFLDEMLNKGLNNTYRVALLAMALSELDKVKYLDRIAQCAQFLLANQSINGNWCYGTQITTPKIIITGSPNPVTPTVGTSTIAVKKIQIWIPPRRKDTNYDNSCTQYALLGLRACADANIEIPLEVWADAEKHLRRAQNPDGGWGYMLSSGRHSYGSYGSMTAGGLGGLAICLFYQNKKIEDDKNIKRAINWFIQNFTVSDNPNFTVSNLHIRRNMMHFHFYYLCALERAGVLLNTESFGRNEWYLLGAQYLLREQGTDGSWNKNEINTDTCFAILFLRRATKPLKIVITDGKD